MFSVSLGRGKVGFTETGRSPDGRRQYVGGIRGLVERNTMRYFLAMETHLNTQSTHLAEISNRWRLWFDATERYPRQLHEADLQGYLISKGIR